MPILEKMLPYERANEMTIAQINAHYRLYDESRLWPISGKFNATERAIRRLRKLRREGLEINGGAEYALALENEISRIVNSI